METHEKGRYALIPIRDEMRADVVAAKIIKYVILSIVGLLIVSAIAVAVIDDATIEASAGPLAGPILAAKHSVAHGISGATNAMGGNSSNKTPSVSQALPPPPAPMALATPVQTKSLADIAAETEQEYTQRQINAEAMAGAAAPSTAPDPMMAPGQAINDVTEQSTTAANPPPSPQIAGTDEIVASPPTASEPLMAEQPAPDAGPPAAPASESPSAETALLDSLNAQPSDDIATLPPELPEEAETPESAVDETSDPNGEQAYAEGLKYYSGEGVERNFGTAAQYFMKASERGHADAQYSLGLMNYVGQTGGQDFTNAAKWFQMAAESGHVQAQYNLGFLYYEGKGVGQDLKTAFGWIDRAAEQGYAKAIKARDALQKAMPEMFGG